MNQDLEHLKLLSIFHYVVGGMAALLACIPFIHFFMGLAMLTGWFPDADPDAPLGVIGGVLMLVAGGIILAGWTFAGLLVLAGRRLAARRSYTFCVVMAGVACMFMPFGTVLGVFTLVVLLRPSARALFEEGVGAEAPAAP